MHLISNASTTNAIAHDKIENPKCSRRNKKKTRKNTYARGENAIKHALQYCLYLLGYFRMCDNCMGALQYISISNDIDPMRHIFSMGIRYCVQYYSLGIHQFSLVWIKH